jgi:UDP-2-acetamido-2,6-beta-L-arabino-hexul-4-ose reductase
VPVTIDKLRRAVDARGQVFEPLDALGLRDQRNVHVVLTEPDQIRGNHFHHVGTEVSTVLGPARVRYRDNGQVTTLDVPADEVWRFVFPPGVVHAFQNTGSAPMIIVSFNTLAHDPQHPDTERDVIL